MTISQLLVIYVRVYFDTNIYSHIAQAGATREIRAALRVAKWVVVASADNLFEIYAIPSADARAAELATLTTIARHFEERPHSYLEAMEVRLAIAKHRPEWIKPIVFDAFSRRRRRDHKDRWRDAKKGVVPPAAAYAKYRRDFEVGTAKSLAFQKDLRIRKIKKQKTTLLKQFGKKVAAVQTNLESPEGFWRSECWLAYTAALVQRDPATRDLADWLLPHLRVERVTAEELFLLWMRDVEGLEVPLARWSGIVAWAQLNSRVTHGNTNDQQHAALMLSTDLFLTADIGLYRTLILAESHYGGPIAKIRLWPRAEAPLAALGQVGSG